MSDYYHLAVTTTSIIIIADEGLSHVRMIMSAMAQSLLIYDGIEVPGHARIRASFDLLPKEST